MADNVALDSGDGLGATAAADDIGGIHYQRVKISWGVDGAAVDASATNPFPITSITLTPGTGASNLGKAEDAAHVSGDVGVMTLTVRQDTAAALGGLDGDYQPPITNANGCLWTIDYNSASALTALQAIQAAVEGTLTVGSHAVTNAGTFAVQAAQSGAWNITNAGTFAVQVDGAALTALQLIDNIVLAEDAAHVSSDPGVQMLAVRQATPANLSGTDGDYEPLQVSAGRLWTSTVVDTALPAGTNNIGDVDILSIAAGDNNIGNVDIVTMPNVTLAAGTNTNEIVGDVAQDAAVAGNPVLMGGRASTATPTAMSADGDAVYQWLTRTGATVVDGAIVDDAAFTPATSRVVPIAFQADETATDSVDEGDAGCPRMTLDRKVITTQYVHAAAGGHTPFRNLDVDETEDDVKTSAGKLFWLHVMNMAATVRYLKIYNATAASVTVGSSTPVLTFPIPTLADTNGAGFTIHFGDAGLAFSTAICIAATTGLGDADTGAPGANEVVVNGGYV